MISDAVSYSQTRSGLPVFGGVVLLHLLALAGMLNYQSAAAKPEMAAATPLTVRWVTPAEELKPEPAVEPQPVVEPEPLPPPEIKKPSPVKVKPKPLKKPKPVVKPVKPESKPKTEPPVSAPMQQRKPAPVKAAIAPAPVEAPKFNAAYLSNPAPVYPRRSRMLEEEGIVKLQVHVSEEGNALGVQLFKSSGFPRLDDAALNAVKRWRFVPAKRGDQSIEGWVIVPVSFKLRS
nr:energy transducer TonB [uncultured Tolumonas sp.]